MRPWLKIQRYFRRKPVRFFSFILLYLTAGSLVFLHSGFSGTSVASGPGGRHAPLAAADRATTTSVRSFDYIRRSFKDTRTTRKYEGVRTKAKISKETEEGRGKQNRLLLTKWFIDCMNDEIRQALASSSLCWPK